MFGRVLLCLKMALEVKEVGIYKVSHFPHFSKKNY